MFKPSYGARTAITITLDSLGNNSVATSNAIDNSSTLAQDYLIDIYIDGTAATNAFLEARILPSADNTNYATWESGIKLGIIDLSVDLQRTVLSLVGHAGFFQAPKYWKLAVKNITGASLAASANVAYYQAVNVENV